MKILRGRRFPALPFAFLAFLVVPTSRVSSAEFSVSDYHRYEQELRLALCTHYWGRVEAVIPDQAGATIRFRTLDVTERRRFSEKSPHPGAEVETLYRLSPNNPPKIWSWESKVTKTLDLRWLKEDGPVPLAPGMGAQMTVDTKGKLVDISYVAAITHWRKGKDGFVEIVLGCATLSKPAKMELIYVRPARMDATADWMNIHWTRKWGLLVTVDWAGPESMEVEDTNSKRPALSLANAPAMQIVPGRDGWKALPSLKDRMDADSKTEAAGLRAWRELENAIPKAQYMRMAG